MTRGSAALAALMLTTLSGAAFGQARPVNPFDAARIHRGVDQLGEMIANEVFKRYDVNRDGWLDSVEASKAAQAVTGSSRPDPRAWKALDLDGDNRLSRNEMRGAMVAMRQRMAVGGAPF
jgi:hypothetical protein